MNPINAKSVQLIELHAFAYCLLSVSLSESFDFIIFESAHINITPCVNLDTGGENIHTVLLSQFTEEYQRRPEVY